VSKNEQRSSRRRDHERLWQVLGDRADRHCPGDSRRVAAVGTARTALDAISQEANVERDVAMGAAETALDAHSNGRPPSQGMSW
jgi:hypothetical protein